MHPVRLQPSRFEQMPVGWWYFVQMFGLVVFSNLSTLMKPCLFVSTPAAPRFKISVTGFLPVADRMQSNPLWDLPSAVTSVMLPSACLIISFGELSLCRGRDHGGPKYKTMRLRHSQDVRTYTSEPLFLLLNFFFCKTKVKK